MNSNEIKTIVESLIGDIDFYYKGVQGSICPFTKENILVSYGDTAKNYDNVDDVMQDLFWDGKSLVEIANQLKPV